MGDGSSGLGQVLSPGAGDEATQSFLDHVFTRPTGEVISQQARTGCGADVTGRISTSGAAGTFSYQWLFRPGGQSPRPLGQSLIAGQQAVYVTVGGRCA